MTEAGLEARLETILRQSPTLMRVLETARDLALPDWMIFSGAIYQRVLNHLTGRDLDYGIKDYDLGYHDASDTSYEAEDLVIRRVAAAFEPPLRELVEVRNQARVHLWFEGKFGEAYAPLASTAEALSRFTTVAFSVGVRLAVLVELQPDVVLDLDAGGLAMISEPLHEGLQVRRHQHVRRVFVVLDLEREAVVRRLVLERSRQDGRLLLGVLPTT